MAKGGHAWQRGCVHGKGGMCGIPGDTEIRTINERAVRILLECILV